MAIAGKSSTPKLIIEEPETINVSGVKETSPIAVPNPERTALVDTRYLPIDKLKAHVEGTDWTVYFYHQLIASGDEAKPLDIDLPAPQQQYRLIKDLAIKVTDPLEYTQDSETLVSEYVGSATVFYNLTPNIGDMFTAKIGDGQYGVFAITAVDRFSFTKQSAFSINYRMVNYLDEVYEIALEEKAVETLVYVPEIQELIESPFLTEEAYHRYLSLDEYRFTIERHLSIRMYDNAVNGLPVPGQSRKTHDPYHTAFCNTLGIAKEHSKPFRTFNCGVLDQSQVPTIWELFISREVGGIKYLLRDIKVAATSIFAGLPNAMSIAYSGYALVMYPDSTATSLDVQSTALLELETPEREPYSKTLSEAHSSDFNKTLPLYHLIDKDDAYVLSEAFYDDIPESKSILEHALEEMLESKPVNPNHILELAEAWQDLDELEKFYYGPMILMLIHYVEGN